MALPSKAEIFCEPFDMNEEELIDTLKQLKTIVVPDNWSTIDKAIDLILFVPNDLGRVTAISLLNGLRGPNVHWALNNQGGISLRNEEFDGKETHQ